MNNKTQDWFEDQWEFGLQFLFAIGWLTRIFLTWLPRLAKATLRAILNPLDVIEWRTAYNYVISPLGYCIVGVLALHILFMVLPSPVDFIFGFMLAVYWYLAEPLAYFVYGNGWAAQDRWIETGVYRYDETTEEE